MDDFILYPYCQEIEMAENKEKHDKQWTAAKKPNTNTNH